MVGLAPVLRTEYSEDVRTAELVRWLRKSGVRFEQGTRHLLAVRGERRVAVPRHPSAELKTGTVMGILKELDLFDAWTKERK